MMAQAIRAILLSAQGRKVRSELRYSVPSIWDTGIIEPAVRGDERGYALQLARNITDAERKLWSSDDPVSWANDAHEIAVTKIYGKLPHDGAIPESYEVQALPIVNEQLAKAGVRLAAVLDKLLQ
jgi:hypothetical protein